MDTANQNLPEGFAQTATNYLTATAALVDVILALAPEECFQGAKDLIAEGRLVPQIQSMPGTMTVSLVDTRTGQSVGDIFQYSAPALLAGGTAH